MRRSRLLHQLLHRVAAGRRVHPDLRLRANMGGLQGSALRPCSPMTRRVTPTAPATARDRGGGKLARRGSPQPSSRARPPAAEFEGSPDGWHTASPALVMVTCDGEALLANRNQRRSGIRAPSTPRRRLRSLLRLGMGPASLPALDSVATSELARDLTEPILRSDSAQTR